MIGGYRTSLLGVIAAQRRGDPFFGDVLLLLDGSGTITTDSSSFGRSLTTVGTPTLDSSVTLFGQPTYGIDGGVTEYVALTSDSFIPAEFGSGEFCVEVHVRPSGAGLNNVFAGFGNFRLWWGSGGNNFGAAITIGSSTYSVVETGGLSPSGNWYHVALVRDKSDPSLDYVRLYVNGALKASTSGVSKSSTVDTSADVGRVVGWNDTGAFGRFANLRLTKGTARYYSNFTPPSAPYPKT